MMSEWFHVDHCPQHIEGPAKLILEEPEWRRPQVALAQGIVPAKAVASRWTDTRTETREVNSEIKANYHTIGLALRGTVLTLSVSGQTIHDGRVATGMFQVSGPHQPTQGVFHAPCDFLHLHISNDLIRECSEEVPGCRYSGDIDLGGPAFSRDLVIEQLARVLIEAEDVGLKLFQLQVDGVGLAIAARLLGVRHTKQLNRSKVSALAKWRLKRAVDFIEANLDQAITLTDLAQSAGLTRMHFAAQFRAATGIRPHDFILKRRIDRAQDLLVKTDMAVVEVALEVGFQTQAHFTTVFRRLVGSTPYRWKQANLM